MHPASHVHILSITPSILFLFLYFFRHESLILMILQSMSIFFSLWCSYVVSTHMPARTLHACHDCQISFGCFFVSVCVDLCSRDAVSACDDLPVRDRYTSSYLVSFCNIFQQIVCGLMWCGI